MVKEKLNYWDYGTNKDNLVVICNKGLRKSSQTSPFYIAVLLIMDQFFGGLILEKKYFNGYIYYYKILKNWRWLSFTERINMSVI